MPLRLSQRPNVRADPTLQLLAVHVSCICRFSPVLLLLLLLLLVAMQLACCWRCLAILQLPSLGWLLNCCLHKHKHAVCAHT